MPKTLLLADDSVTIQKVVGISFANEDVALLTVDNGDDAIARAREAQPDIVLADVVMPGMNGYEVCEAIKSDPQLRSTPVLLLTGTFEAFDEERAARAGADGHITKPFEAQALVDQVNARLAQAAAAAPVAEPTPPEQTPAPEDSLGLASAPDTSSEGGASFDFFDEEITEPGTTPAPAQSAETMIVSDDLETDGEDAFAFEAGDDFREEITTSSLSSDGSEVDAVPEILEPLEEPEMAADSTVAILPDDEAFTGAPAESPEASSALGEEDLAQVEPEELSVIPAAATPFVDFAGDVPAEPAETRIIAEPAALEVSPDPMSEAISDAADEPVGLSDLESDPLSDPFAAASDTAEAGPPEDHPADPLGGADPDDLAVEAVLDPAGGREFDVSSADLGDALQGPETAAEATEEQDPSPWMAEEPVLEEAEILSEPAVEGAPEPAPELLVTPMEDAPPAASAPDLSPLTREQLRDALEKIAWEAFSDVTERIVQDAVERIERVAWEAIPQMAEALIREEIRKLKGEND
jgi:CheY-like chemotaxis protein